MLSHYKERFTYWADPVARALLALRLRPNHLTVLGLGVSVLAALSFARGRSLWGAVLLILAGLFDFFDGSLARLSGQVTP
ncbi:MAG: CDP-alcohol phosphatidyltransferase family protein, partial [candidate division NC10 bacterium]